jgi:hypothetical protein
MQLIKVMIYPSDVITKAAAINQLGNLFLRGGEAGIAEQYARSWAAAANLRAKYPDYELDQLCKVATNKFIGQVSAAGAASGAIAAAPIFGLVSTVGSTAADLYFFGRSSVNHILLLAAMHDLQLEDEQLRRLTVLSSFLNEPNHLQLTDSATTKFIENLNNKLAQRVVIKVGAKLLPARAGAALPLFIGAVTAAGINARLAQQISNNAFNAIRLQEV